MLRRQRGKPVEQALTARNLGQQHHAGQEQIDIRSFGNSGQRGRRRNQPQHDKQRGAADRPDGLDRGEGTDEDTGDRQCGDDPDGEVR